MLGVPDAYELPAVPGLGYLKSDQSTLVRFKAAYVSGPPPAVTGGPPAARVSAARREASCRSSLGEVSRGWSRTEAEASRAAEASAVAAAEEQRTVCSTSPSRRMTGTGPPAHQVWLPPLDVPAPSTSCCPDLAVDPELGLISRTWRSRGPLRFPLGIVDRPREQRRDMLRVDLSGAAGHVAVVGRPASGKSTLLRTIVTGLALTHTPRESQFYCLDFGGGTLTAAARPAARRRDRHPRRSPTSSRRIVAEVARLVDRAGAVLPRQRHRLDRDLPRRRRAGGSADDGYGDVFLVVDGWGTIRADFDELEGELQVLAQRGLTFGVHLVTSATRWTDFRTGVRDVLGTRLELRLGDPMDSEIDRKLAANVPLERPGRGIMQAKHHFLGALPRIDGDNNAGSLGSGVQKLVDRGARRLAGPARPEAAAAADAHHGARRSGASRPPRRRCCSASTSARWHRSAWTSTATRTC